MTAAVMLPLDGTPRGVKPGAGHDVVAALLAAGRGYYRTRAASRRLKGSPAAEPTNGKARCSSAGTLVCQLLGCEQDKPVKKKNYGATGNLHGGPTGADVYSTGNRGAATDGAARGSHGRGGPPGLPASGSSALARDAAAADRTAAALLGEAGRADGRRGRTGGGRLARRQVRRQQQRPAAAAKHAAAAAAAAAAPARTVASVLGTNIVARVVARNLAKASLAPGLPAAPPVGLGLRGVRMTKAGGVAQWGGGTKGKMGRQAKSSPGTRHGGKPTFGVYNPGGLSDMRWNLVRTHLAPKVDVLGLPEFSNPLAAWKGKKFAEQARGKLIVPKAPKKGDGSGSAAILLSPRMTALIVQGSEGSCGSRIVYVRLKVGINFLFVICAYIEYWDRGPGKGEQAKATHQRMQEVIDSQAKTGDCLVVLTDANARLGPTGDGLAGQYCVARKPNDAGKALMTFMRANKLVAANTQFKPQNTKHSRHKGGCKALPGCVTYRPQNGKGGTPAQLDYILVSSRWFSSVENCRVLWATTLLAQTQFRVDHGCVVARWQCRVRRTKPVVKLNPKSYAFPETGLRCENAGRLVAGLAPLTELQYKGKLDKPKVGGWSTQQLRFDAAVETYGADQYVKKAVPVLVLPAPPEIDCATPNESVLEQQYKEVCSLYSTMVDVCKAVWAELDPMPKRPYEAVMTDRTRDLLEERRRAVESDQSRRGDWPEQRRRFAHQIRQSCLKDWQEWVGKQADEMTAAAANGDSAKVAQVVKTLGGKKASFCSKAPTRAPKHVLQPDGSTKIEWGKGDPFESALALADAWREFAAGKFAETAAELLRADMEDLGPAASRADDRLSLQEKEEGLACLKKMKSPGRDGIPIELYQHSPLCRQLLFDLLDKMWMYESVPEELVRGTFVTIFKDKGSPDDMTKYRFICLLNHASKLLSVCQLRRLVEETDHYLPSNQAGFRKGRGTRDNIWILAQLMDAAIDRGNEMITVFIDFVAAFDSVSHKFLDQALKAAGASKKSRAIWRAMYERASAAVRVRSDAGAATTTPTLASAPTSDSGADAGDPGYIDGTNTYSASFGVHRGVVQGAIDSPWYFILALELIFKQSDCEGGIDMDLPCGKILRLCYADDAALLCNDGIEASVRLTSIAVYSRKHADMEISRPKTEAQDVRKAPTLPIPTEAQITAALGDDAFVCTDCTRPFSRERSLQSHYSSATGCKWKTCAPGCGKTDPMATIYDVRGGGDVPRFFATEKVDGTQSTRRLRSGHRSGVTRDWIPEPIVRQMPGGPEAIDVYLRDCATSCFQERVVSLPLLYGYLNGNVRIEDDNEERCPWCCEITMPGGAVHAAKECPRLPGTRGRVTCTVQDVHRKWRQGQDQRVHVKMENEEIKTSDTFTYLGHLFTSDNDQTDNLDQRIGRANSVFKSLKHIWQTKKISTSLKKRIYLSAVISVLVYGHECWMLTDDVIRKLNGFNARCLATIYIGHRTVTADERIECIKEQSVAHGTVSRSGIIGKRILDITAVLRARRLTWLGHILRLSETELQRQVLLYETYESRHLHPGGILMDAPEHSGTVDDLRELIRLAGNHDTDEGEEMIFRWRQHVAALIPEDHRTKPIPQQRTDRFAIVATPLSREENDAAIIAENVRQLETIPEGGLLLYSDGGANGNGAGGVWGDAGFGVCAARKNSDWSPSSEPNILDEYFGPVVIDAADPYYLGAERGTNNTGELNGIATALLHLKYQGGHEPAIICYDSKYAANITDGTWEAKSNIEAARINRDLHEAEHIRRTGGVILSHCKAHSGDTLNDVADANVQHGKRPCDCGKQPCVCFSRLKLSGPETGAESRQRILALANRRTISATTPADSSTATTTTSRTSTTSTARHVDNPLHAPLPPRPSEASALAGICLEDWNDSLLVTR